MRRKNFSMRSAKSPEEAWAEKELLDLREKVTRLKEENSHLSVVAHAAEIMYRVHERGTAAELENAARTLWTTLIHVKRLPLAPPRSAFEVVLLPRGAGKTREMVIRTISENGVLITANKDRGNRILGDYPGLRPDQIFSWAEAPYKLRGHRLSTKRQVPIYIDDADWILSDLLDFRISGISATL